MIRQDSLAGSVNQANGLPDFEDVLRTGARVGQDFQPACVCTNPREGVADPKFRSATFFILYTTHSGIT